LRAGCASRRKTQAIGRRRTRIRRKSDGIPLARAAVMASWRAALIVAAVCGGPIGCAHSAGGEDFELGGEGGGRIHNGADEGAGGTDLASSSDGPTATSGGPTGTSASNSSGASTTGPASSAAATSVASSTSGSPATCDGSGNCDQCAQCAESGTCQGALDGCFNDNACALLVQCLSTCQNQQCADQCFTQYQQGLPSYDQLFGCVVCGECPSDCDGPAQGC